MPEKIALRSQPGSATKKLPGAVLFYKKIVGPFETSANVNKKL